MRKTDPAQPIVNDTPAETDTNPQTDVYRPTTHEVLYSTLLDDSPIVPAKQPQPKPDATDRVTYAPVAKNLDSQAPQSNDNDTLATPLQPYDGTTLLADTTDQSAVLHRTHHSEALTDNHILNESHQLQSTQDRLEYDNNATSSLIEHLGVATRQWLLTLNWQRTDIPKAGLMNKLKNRTELLDLDLSCLLCNRYGEVLEQIWFKNVRDHAESIRHQGDELLGTRPPLPANIAPELADKDVELHEDLHVDGQDRQFNQERISIYLNRIPPTVFHVVLLVSSYQGHPLSAAKRGVCQLSDDEGTLIQDVSLSSLPSDATALWLATLTRSADSWRFNADNSPLTGKKFEDLVQQVSEHLVRTAK